MMDSSSSHHERLLRLKIASEIVLGNQASVAFSRAFYLEDLLIERVIKEFHELSEDCQRLLDELEKFTEEELSKEKDLSPISESKIHCECSKMIQTLGTEHKPSLDGFQNKLVQAKARRQAKSCLLERLSTQSNNITAQFNSMTLGELLSEVHIPEFSCFINDSDFGILEKLVNEWDQYRASATEEFRAFEKKLYSFQIEIEKNRKMREQTCDMIIAQITQQKLNNNVELCGTETLKKRGLIHKVSTLLRRQTQKDSKKDKVNSSLSKSPSMSSMEKISTELSLPEATSNSNLHNQTF